MKKRLLVACAVVLVGAAVWAVRCALRAPGGLPAAEERPALAPAGAATDAGAPRAPGGQITDGWRDVKFVKMSGADHRAVVKTLSGELRLVGVGDRMGGRGRVVEIEDGRVVIEEQTAEGLETVIVRVQGGKADVRRIRKAPPPAPALLATREGAAGAGGGE
jgi:hypothetical protein